MSNMRSTAYKLKIEDLVKGQYVRSAEGEPSRLVSLWGQEILRAHFIATVVDKFIRDDNSYAVLRLDDGSETIRAKAWREDVEHMAEFEVGDLVEVIGGVREYEGEIHLVPDVLKRVEDPNWELVRELEILHARKKLVAQGKRPKPGLETKPKVMEAEPPEGEPEQGMGVIEKLEEPPLPEVADDLKKKALLAIEKFDGEGGISVTDLAVELDISQGEAEDVLRVLINEDQIFEPKAGKFKHLR
jgi:RPA family protein